MSHRIRKPQQVVGAPSPKPTAARFVPPVLDIAFHEPPARRPQQVFPHEIGLGWPEGHDVLELVAESARAARLVVPRTSPQPTTHRLIEEPTIHHQIE